MNLRQALLSWQMPSLVARLWFLGHSVLQSSWGPWRRAHAAYRLYLGAIYRIGSPDVFVCKGRWVAEKAADMRFECRFFDVSTFTLWGHLIASCAGRAGVGTLSARSKAVCRPALCRR